jgi:hypothetical protein
MGTPKDDLARPTSMVRRRLAAFCGLSVTILFCGALSFGQKFREYPGWEYENFPLPSDYRVPGEWTFARLMYPSVRFSDRPYSPYWQQGGTNWTIDYPRSDRHLSEAVRRLTRIQTRSVEQPINLDEGDDVYNFLLRGGFFMCDDFHGTQEWAVFIASMQRVFPDRAIVEIDNADAIFHTIFDLDDRYQVPGEQFVYTHRVAEKDGFEARWRGIYDDKGRLMVAICHNMDLGDSWEHADNPRYPEKYSALGIRIGVNYITYAMTH